MHLFKFFDKNQWNGIFRNSRKFYLEFVVLLSWIPFKNPRNLKINHFQVKDDVIKLNEEQNDAIIEQQAQPEMVFPLKNTTIDKPIIVDAARFFTVILENDVGMNFSRGEDVILECVISRANIVWIKQNDTTPIITLNDREARVYQEWGNLRINKVTVGKKVIFFWFLGIFEFQTTPEFMLVSDFHCWILLKL